MSFDVAWKEKLEDLREPLMAAHRDYKETGHRLHELRVGRGVEGLTRRERLRVVFDHDAARERLGGLQCDASQIFAAGHGWAVWPRGFTLDQLRRRSPRASKWDYSIGTQPGIVDHPQYFVEREGNPSFLRPAAILAHPYDHVTRNPDRYIPKYDPGDLLRYTLLEDLSWYYPGRSCLVFVEPVLSKSVKPTTLDFYHQLMHHNGRGALRLPPGRLTKPWREAIEIGKAAGIWKTLEPAHD